MARILVNNVMVRFPMGGMNLWAITWLIGLQRLGHDVYLLEDIRGENTCYDNQRGIWTTNCTYGITVTKSLLERYSLGDNWSFIDFDGKYHGLSRAQVDELFRTADVFLDLEWGPFYDRAADIPIRIFIDNEPGLGQIKLVKAQEAGIKLRDYDHFYTIGLNIGTDACSVPTMGIDWHHIMTPVLLDHDPIDTGNINGRFSTVMKWNSKKKPKEFRGKTYGKKGIEFERFMELPRHIKEEIEVAVSGPAPIDRITRHGWIVRDANEVARSVDTFRAYIAGSKGEFSIAKNSFIETQCGWWGDRAGVYLSYGKPVVLQDAGFSKHMPCGQGLFAVQNVEEAAEAIAEINADYRRHSHAAREIAEEYLSVEKVLGKLLKEVGLQ
jgi:hypothetical protein